jgi:hypothetical protein
VARAMLCMLDMRTSLALLLLLTACGEPVVTPADIRTAPRAFVGAPVWIDGRVDALISMNAAACPGRPATEPCNNAGGTYGYVGNFDTGVPQISFVAAADWPFAERATGRIVQSCYDDFCRGNVRLGCSGNDVELVCAPALPSRILRVHGRVTTSESFGIVFEVDDLELDESAPTTGSVTIGGRSIQMIEP